MTADLDLEGLRSLLNIDPNNVVAVMARQGELYSRVCDMHQLQWDEVSRAKLDLAILEAELDLKARAYLSQSRSGNQWVMEPEVEAQIHREPRWKLATERVDAAYSLMGRIAAVRDGFAHRKDMLSAIAAQLRQQQAMTAGYETASRSTSA